MTLTPGTRLGPHEIVAAIGAGGMGEVYRARDTRLGRDVAIKVLPEHLSQNPEVRARFEREARAVSALNHPNICTLYDVGHQDGIDYLVLELVEGESLAQRLERGPIPADLLLRTGIEISDALERAHRSGIVHRDLKPGNVMLTKTGAKLMDFGLARSAGLNAASGSLSQSPTQTRPLTTEGAIVGTFQYMSPEQLEGRDADPRSDLWAFGATLYEMATGKKAFEGRSQASLIASILEREPTPIAEIAPLAPPGLDRLVRGCLAKDPEQRVQTAHDAKLQLQWIAEGGSLAGVPAPIAARRRSRESLAWTLAAIAGVMAIALAVFVATRRAPPAQVVRFQATAPSGIHDVRWPRLSPDGKTLAFLGVDSTSTRHIWMRRVDAFEAFPLPLSEPPGRPFWSPDGKYLGFLSGGRIRKVASTGGPGVTIGEAAIAGDGSWGRDVILFDGTATDSIRMIPANGGAIQPATRIDRANGESGNAWPHFLPDGVHFLYQGIQGATGLIRLGKVGSLEARTLGTCDGRIEYASPGYLVFTRDGTLMAQPFDAARLETHGDPIPIGDRVSLGNTSGEFSVSQNGVLAYHSGESSRSRMVWVDRAGKVLDASCPPGEYNDFSLSPDERQVAVTISEAGGNHSDIWIYDMSRRVMSRFTFLDGIVVWPLWSPDGARIAYASNPNGEFRVFLADVGGRGAIDTLDHPPGVNEGPVDWSRDGRLLLVDASTSTNGWDIAVHEGHGPATTLVTGRTSDRHGRISPDGRWITYSSNASGRREVYLQPYPGAGRKLQVSPDGGFLPFWSRDGRELYFISGPSLMAVSITPADPPEIGPPVRLFDVQIVDDGFSQHRIACSADGRRFLVLTPENGDVPQFSVVTNWISELNRR